LIEELITKEYYSWFLFDKKKQSNNVETGLDCSFKNEKEENHEEDNPLFFNIFNICRGFDHISIYGFFQRN
jgi:hypothetical protein